MHYIRLDENNRIVFSMNCFDYIPSNMIPINSAPTEHPITDYLYKNGEFTYDPLPEPDPEPDPEPTTEDRLDAIEAAIMDIASTMYDNKIKESITNESEVENDD